MAAPLLPSLDTVDPVTVPAIAVHRITGALEPPSAVGSSSGLRLSSRCRPSAVDSLESAVTASPHPDRRVTPVAVTDRRLRAARRSTRADRAPCAGRRRPPRCTGIAAARCGRAGRRRTPSRTAAAAGRGGLRRRRAAPGARGDRPAPADRAAAAAAGRRPGRRGRRARRRRGARAASARCCDGCGCSRSTADDETRGRGVRDLHARARVHAIAGRIELVDRGRWRVVALQIG